jgi:hypothetical protein
MKKKPNPSKKKFSLSSYSSGIPGLFGGGKMKKEKDEEALEVEVEKKKK